jgi:rubrerythrin
MDTQNTAKAVKPKAVKQAKAISEVVSFRLPIKEYEALAAEARVKKMLIGDLARDKYRHGETFSSVVKELQGQRDAVDGLRAELGEQLSDGVALLAGQVRSAMQDQAMRSAIAEGIERGVTQIMKKIYKEGESPSERKAREAAEGQKAGRT